MSSELKELYERKTGDLLDAELPNLHEVPGHGFTSWLWDDARKTIVSIATAGDGGFWEAYYRAVARQLGAERLRMVTYRNPEAMCRRFGMRVVGHVLEREF